MPKRRNEIDHAIREKIEIELRKRLAAKPRTVQSYAIQLHLFCKAQQIDPFDFPKLGLEEIEDRTETHMLKLRDKIAPKTLNLQFCAIKTWCFALHMIKNRKLFREIDFDKDSRKTDAMTEKPLETEHIKKIMQISDAYEQALVGLLGLDGLRPSLLSQLKVGNLNPEDYTIENGKLVFKTQNPFLSIPKDYEGNKAHITFFVILPTKITQQLMYCVNNTAEPVTPQTKLIKKYAETEQTVYQKCKEIFRKIGFVGRPYLLRSYADRLLDRNLRNPTSEKRDEDLKEFMLGHKGKISAIYQFKALSHEDKAEYLKAYSQVDKWINEKIFSIVSNESLEIASATAKFAETMGAPKEKIAAILELFSKNKLSLDAYEKQLKGLTETTMKETMKQQVRSMMQEIQQEGRPT